MNQIHLCFLWHMHQPFYRDLVSNEYKLPYTRLHALKDYPGMVEVLEEFPQIRQNFNLVPSMLVQIEEYAAGQASDPFLRAALMPAGEMSEALRVWVLQNFFYIAPRLMRRLPRYAQLWEKSRMTADWTVQEFRDLQVLSQLAWFDEQQFEHDPEIVELTRKGRNFEPADQERLGQKQTEALSRVIGVYRSFRKRGQIEISCTPFYHPILPLLCDSGIASIAHPGVRLPSRFQYPEDARLQLSRAREFMQDRFGEAPRGLWPSEGSVSDAALQIAAECGYTWFATDNEVLGRTLHVPPSPEVTYRPYRWSQNQRELYCVFRDHYLSDLIGFTYANHRAEDAAADFLRQIQENCAPILRSGEDALVPIILDGENAWEYYERNGRPFLRELYRRIEANPLFHATTLSDAFTRIEPRPLKQIHPGSWIHANFDIWIGADEDNQAWELLLEARRLYDEHPERPEADRKLALESLLIAEGSDWCWWYGPEHDTPNRAEFDQLFRSHLANVYRALGLPAPDRLSRPIAKLEARIEHQHPTGAITPSIDGKVTSYFEWLGAGFYRWEKGSGAMHGSRGRIRELRYGTDGKHLYLRLDFEGIPSHAEVRVELERETLAFPLDRNEPDAAFVEICEIRLPPASKFRVALWQNGQPADALPVDGWIEMAAAEGW